MNELKDALRELFDKILNKENNIQFFGVDASSKQSASRRKLAQLLHTIQWIMHLERSNLYATKRDIYYTNVMLFDKKQREFEAIIQHIANKTCLSSQQLRLLSSSKGLVHGNLIIQLKNGCKINCQPAKEMLIPAKELVLDVHVGEPERIIIIVVEKDAFFQFLRQNMSRLSREIERQVILITVTRI